MQHKSTQAEAQSSRTWERLKAFVREHVLRFIQAVLEADWSSPRHVGCCGIVVRLSSRGGKRSLLVGVGLSLVSVWWPLTLVPAQEGLSQKEQQQIEAQAALMAAEELYDHGQPDKAIEQWREALRLDPSLTKAHHDLGLALRDKSQLVEAVAELRAAIRLDPRNASAQADLGDALQERGDLAGALTAYRAAVDLVPNSAPLHSNLGYLLVRKGDLDGAIAEWREAARLDPKYPPPHANLGEALESKGDAQGAIAAYEHFLELAPSAPNAAAVRKRLTALKAAGKR